VPVGDEPTSIRALDALIEQFGGGMPVQIVWECGSAMPCATVIDRPFLDVEDCAGRRWTAGQRARAHRTGQILTVSRKDSL